jgi:nucleotide-binding universal stress UspA family protein
MLDKILVAVDGSKHSDAAFALALDMAKKYDSQLFVINVYQGGAGAGTMVSPGYEEDQRSIAQEILDSYEAKANEAGLPNVRMLLRKGDAAQVIIETANNEKCRLIILGSRGRGAFKELLLGSVSHKVANHAGCAVLIVR